MNSTRETAKIAKLAEKRKSDAIIKIMNKADNEITGHCLNALAQINDEAASNAIAHCMDNPDSAIKIAACKAALIINTDYMKTHVHYVLSKETNSSTKEQIQTLLNDSRK